MNNTGKGLLIYLLGVIGPLVVLFGFKDNDKNITFHAYQSLTMTIACVALYLVLSILALIPFVGVIAGIALFVVPIFFLVLEILGIIKVCNNDPEPKLVLVGDLTETFFGKQINVAPSTVSAAPQQSFDPNTGQPVTQPPVSEPVAEESTTQPETTAEQTTEELSSSESEENK